MKNKLFILISVFVFTLGCKLSKIPEEKPHYPYLKNLEWENILKLPVSTSREPIFTKEIAIIVTTNAIFVESEKVVDLANGAVDPSKKRDGAKGIFIEPLYQSLKKALHKARSKKKMSSPWMREVVQVSPCGKTVNNEDIYILVDRRTGYGLLSEVIYTAGKAEFYFCKIIVQGKNKSFTELHVSSPDFCETSTEKFNLAVIVTDEGFHLSLGKPTFSLDDLDEVEVDRLARSIITKRETGYDYESLTKKLREIKSENEEESLIMIGAEKEISYDVIVKVLDASRSDDEGEMFPNVVLLESNF